MTKEQKNDYLLDLIQDLAIIHNLHIKEAGRLKQLHGILLGAQNALESGMYDDVDYEEFKSMIRNDLEEIYGKEV